MMSDLDTTQIAPDKTDGLDADAQRQFDLEGDKIGSWNGVVEYHARPDLGRPVTTVIGQAPRRVNGAAGPLSSVTAPLAAVPARPTDAAYWSRCLHHSLAVEIRLAVASGVLTAAEGDQLLARLVLVIDQAVASPWP
jgi:hypothetical protein